MQVGGREIDQKVVYCIIGFLVLFGVLWYLHGGGDVSDLGVRADEVRADYSEGTRQLDAAGQAVADSQNLTRELRQENQRVGDAVRQSSDLNKSSAELLREEQTIFRDIRQRGPVSDYTLKNH